MHFAIDYLRPMNAFVYIYIYIYVCIYTHIYTHSLTRTHTHTNAHIHTYRESLNVISLSNYFAFILDNYCPFIKELILILYIYIYTSIREGWKPFISPPLRYSSLPISFLAIIAYYYSLHPIGLLLPFNSVLPDVTH